jgi:hypothetical protein
MMVRDVAAESDFVRLDGPIATEGDAVVSSGEDTALGLAGRVEVRVRDGAVFVHGEVRDTTGKDRAVTAYFALPIDAMGWQWSDDMRAGRVIEAGTTYINSTNIGAGLTGYASLYPLATISGPDEGVALGVPLDQPRVCRLAYDSSSRELYAAFDLGLTADAEKMPSRADFSLVIYSFQPKWRFRAALAEFYRLFPEHFERRATHEGIWMPFTDIATVKQPEGFYFAYHEGNDNVAYDDAHDVLSFVYIEPMTYWMSMPKDATKTREAAMSQVRDEAAKGDIAGLATLSSCAEDSDGNLDLVCLDAPWCSGAVFTLNADPGLRAPAGGRTQWDRLRGIVEGAMAAPTLDGVYLDSLEGWADRPNYRRDAFRSAGVPLTFGVADRLPMILTYFSTYELTVELSKRMHDSGKLLMANATPWRFPWAAHALDVMGTETNWAPEGKWSPDSGAIFNLRRALCRQKPYLLLQNTVYDTFPRDMVERYFARSVFYGVFPSFFSHNAADDPYWQRPALYDAHRDLFRKYLPVCQRISRAGWEPVTLASTPDPDVWLERYGNAASGDLHITVLNTASDSREVSIELDLAGLGLAGTLKVADLIDGRDLRLDGNAIHLTLGAEQAAAIEVGG